MPLRSEQHPDFRSAVRILYSGLAPRSLPSIASTRSCSVTMRACPARKSSRQVYATKAWGGVGDAFYSGGGSTMIQAGPMSRRFALFYRKAWAEQRARSRVRIFRVGRQLVSPTMRYVGMDIVPTLIAHNTANFGTDNVRFMTGDIVGDELPSADLCLVRQVLQHLSNAEIARDFVEKLRAYGLSWSPSDYPSPEVRLVPIFDKPHGADIRIDDNSAVVLDAEPFNVDGVELLLEVPAATWLVRPGEILKTFLLKNYPSTVERTLTS